MMLGRNPALWLALVAAALNAGVLVFGLNLTVEQLAALNALAAAFVGVVANEADPTAVGTFSRTTTRPLLRSGTGTSSTAGSSTGQPAASGDGGTAPTGGPSVGGGV